VRKEMRDSRLSVVAVFSLQLLSACGSSSVGSESGTITPPSSGIVTSGKPVPPSAGPGVNAPKGSDDEVLATPSVAGTMAVAVGATQTVSVAFTSTDGLEISGFAVSGSLSPLPAGWSGPATFSCAAVGPGSGCVLVLTYSPIATDNGTLTLDCVYVDNAGLARTPGPCLTIAYAATASNNLVADVAPMGEIDALVGASKQTINVNFTSDDGNAVTDFAVTTDLSALPSGWSSSATAFSCSIVSTGSGCALPLTFAPSTAARGTLLLNYSYRDDSGAARSGALNIPYATTVHDSVIANASPVGQINAVATSGARSVAVTFVTDDGRTATDLQLLSDLTALPPGWSSKSAVFACSSVSTGNGCQLPLSYAPTALGSGAVTLRYEYINSSGAAGIGLVNIAYAATTDDAVVGTASPSGQVNAMLGAAGQPVLITFSTDDSRLATALRLTSSLAALPPGWSSAANSFACSELSSGTGCQLTLMYAPTALDNGMLTLTYTYVNNAGTAKTGSVGISYRTTTNDSIVATSNPVSLAVATGSSNAVTITFTTDDGNMASAVAADLTSLPPDWSSPSSAFTCASVSTGTGCQLHLSYSATTAANNTLSLPFSYVNNSGTTKTGTASIPYVASP
jgi:hypothetical protein